MATKPNRWVAVLLGILVFPVAMMYVAEIGLAAIYILIALAITAAGEFYVSNPSLISATQLIFTAACVFHPYHLAKTYSKEGPRPIYSQWYSLLGAAILFTAITFSIRAFVVEAFSIPSASMLPTIPLRSTISVQKWGYGNYGAYGIHLARSPISAPLNRGDIIVFEFPPDRSLYYAKRLIGLPGDEIAYRDGVLYVNGNKIPTEQAGEYRDPTTLTTTHMLTESLPNAAYPILLGNVSSPNVQKVIKFPFDDSCTRDLDHLTCKVPPDHYFTLGDNRDNSHDSRMWGFVPTDHVVGKVFYVVR